MVQVMASGEVADTAQMREVIRNSFDTLSFEPEHTGEWALQFERYLNIKEGR